MNSKDFREYLLYCLFFYFLCIFIMPQAGAHGYDNWCSKNWTLYIFNDGLGRVYIHSDVNYNPVYLYLLKAFSLIQGSAEKITANHLYIRALVFIFDVVSALLAGWYFSKRHITPVKAFIILFNIAFVYNTLIWGQVDSIHTAFVFAALLAAFFDRTALSVVLLLLALNTKLQAIVYLPLLVIIWLPQLLRNPVRLFYSVIAALLLQTLLFLPFIIEKGQLANALALNGKLVDWSPFVSLNAYNIWYLIANNAAVHDQNDSTIFYLISYKRWGLVWFMLSATATLLPIFVTTLSLSLRKLALSKKDWDVVVLSAILVTLNFFYFNTQMHERYSHPVVLFSGVYAVLTGRYLLYFLLSLAYFLNMEEVLRFMHISYGTLIFMPQFIAGLFGIGMILGYYYLYKDFSLRTELAEINNTFSARRAGLSSNI